MSGPGFIFWGFFPVLATVVGAYVIWMLLVERRERRRGSDRERRPR